VNTKGNTIKRWEKVEKKGEKRRTGGYGRMVRISTLRIIENLWQ